MIHYHGLPVTPATAAVRVCMAGHAFVSWAHHQQLTVAVEYCQSLALDNGAFSAWRRGQPITDWSSFYDWVREVMCPSIDFVVIPDVIDGNEADNDRLLAEWPFGKFIGAPVWHMHESLERLERLASNWPRVCLGSSGEFAEIGTAAWWNRMNEAMTVVCDADGRPGVKLHGLRMLDPDIFARLPFSSADSTNIGRNIGIDKAWRGTYQPPTKEARADVMRARIESNNAPPAWRRQLIQESLCLL